MSKESFLFESILDDDTDVICTPNSVPKRARSESENGDEEAQLSRKKARQEPTAPTRVATSQRDVHTALVDPPPNVQSLFDLYEPETWVNYPGGESALVTYLEAEKTKFLKDVKNWFLVSLAIPALFDADKTRASDAASSVKQFLKPKPTHLITLMEAINKLKAVPWYTREPASGVGFAECLVLGLQTSDTTRFVLPKQPFSSPGKKAYLPVLAWNGIPSNRSVAFQQSGFAWDGSTEPTHVTKEHDSVLIVTGESGSGKTTLLLLLLKTILEALKRIFQEDKNFALDNVAAVTLYVKPKEDFQDAWSKTANELNEFWNWVQTNGWPSPDQIKSSELDFSHKASAVTLSDRTKRFLFHTLQKKEREQLSFKVEEDHTLLAAIQSWQTIYEQEKGSPSPSHHKILRNYIMYEVLVEGARSLLQNTREGDLLELLKQYAEKTLFHLLWWCWQWTRLAAMWMRAAQCALYGSRSTRHCLGSRPTYCSGWRSLGRV